MRTVSLALLVALFGCGDSSEEEAASGTGVPGDNGFTQPGAQDLTA